MPLPRYSLDNDAEGSDEEFEESYTSNDAASSSRLPSISTIPLGAGSPAPPSVSRRSLSPSISTYDAPSSLDTDALLASTADPTTSATCSKSRIPPTAIGWPYSSASPINALSAFEQLTLYMSTQKAAPEVLPFPTGSFELLVSQMEQQQSILDSLLHVSSTTQNPEAVEDEYGEAGKGGIDEDEFLRLNLVQVDLERCKWLLKQILRSRIDLLHKYAGFIAVRQMEKRKLNATEERFVNEYWQLKKDHFHSAVLGFLPEQLHELTSGQSEESLSQQDHPSNTSSNMVPGPDLNAPVFIRCLEDCGSIPLPDGEEATLGKDSIHLLRYRSVRGLVYQGSVVLL